MRITIRQMGSRKFSSRYLRRLKKIVREVAPQVLKAEGKSVQEIRLQFRADYNHFYPKQRPLAGFERLVPSPGQVTITFADFYNQNHHRRLSFLVHELVHAKQILSKQLVIKKGNQILWKQKVQVRWKQFRTKTYYQLPKGSRRAYVVRHFPWERAVSATLQRMWPELRRK